MINMNMMKEAIDVLINSEKHILIIGETGTGKSTLLAELLINSIFIARIIQIRLFYRDYQGLD